MAVFAIVVEAGSFAEAARQLDRAPSAVSAQVSRLEKTLGLRLLLRTTRSVALTPAGERLLPACRQALAARESVAAIARGLSEVVNGPLRVTAPGALVATWAIPAAAALLRLHPHVDFSLTETDVRMDLDGGDVDVALRVGRLSRQGLTMRRVGALEEVRVRPTGGAARQVLLPWQQPAEAPGIRVNSVAAAVAAVQAGLGWAVLPEPAVRQGLSTGVLETESAPRAVPVYAAHAYGRNVPNQVRAFIDALVGSAPG